MKEIVKPVLTWLLGLFNVGVYMDDGIDSLLMTLQYLELEEQANEIVHIYYTMQFFVWAKFFLMFLSVIFLYIANQGAIERAARWLWSKTKKAWQVFKKTIQKLFKTKQQN